MSIVPFTTQPGYKSATQLQSQENYKIVLVYYEAITERQSTLMRECQTLLCQNLGILVKQDIELETLSSRMRFFVVPCADDGIIKKIRTHFEKPIIYLPRSVIEARSFHHIELPVRNLAVSLTMIHCRVFLVKSCDKQIIRYRINEMCGTVVTSFNGNPNVVIADRADNKYCAKAFKKKIPVVSKSWIDDNYSVATEEDGNYFNHDAMSNIVDHQIKPFYNLYFKFLERGSVQHIKRYITENQGHIVYGDESCLTHIVSSRCESTDSVDSATDCKATQKPKIVDSEFLMKCLEVGYYIPKKEYSEIYPKVNVKTEKSSQPIEMNEENKYNPTHDSYNHKIQETILMPPPSVTRSASETTMSMSDMILKALSTCEPAQTQQISTQIRRLPDREIQIERTFEPSQQLYWNDKQN